MAPAYAVPAHRLLTAEEERALGARRLAGDMAARERLIVANLGLVRQVAGHYVTRAHSLTYDDLVGYGAIGLMTAVDKYDPAAHPDNRFCTHAMWWIRQAITRALAEHDHGLIAIPMHVREVAAQRGHTRARLAVEMGREPSGQEVRMATPPNANARRGKPPNEALQAAAVAVRLVDSLDVAISHETPDRTLGDTLADPDPAVDGDAVAERIGEEDALAGLWRACCALLNAREQQVMALRCGIGPDGDVLARKQATRRPLGKVPATADVGVGWLCGELHALADVGREMGISRERVRQIESDALRKLRAGLTLDAASGSVTAKTGKTTKTRAKTKARTSTRAKGGAPTHDDQGTYGPRIAALLDADPTLTIVTLAARAGVSRDTAWRHARAWRAAHTATGPAARTGAA